MANSGIVWIDTVFNWCVRLLYDVAAIMGITYEEINVYLFVIIGPLVLLLSILLNIYLLYRIRENSLTKNPYYGPKPLAQTHKYQLGRFY
jgi:type III secretory pathway component EscT